MIGTATLLSRSIRDTDPAVEFVTQGRTNDHVSGSATHRVEDAEPGGHPHGKSAKEAEELPEREAAHVRRLQILRCF